MNRSNRATVSQLKHLLSKLMRAGKCTGDEAERIYDDIAATIRGLARDGILEALDVAVGRSKTRKRASVYVLAELTDIPEAVERLGKEVTDPDWRCRHWIIQTIGFHRLTKLAPLLNKVILDDPDDLCRQSAINAAGQLKQDVNFKVILDLAAHDYPGLEAVLMEYAREEGRDYLRRTFDRPIDEHPYWLRIGDFTSFERMKERMDWECARSRKVFAAWGLAKLGDREAIAYLGRMLYDPDYKGRNYSFHGESLRAAQALADLFDLPFEWGKSYIPVIRRWWEDNGDEILAGKRPPSPVGPRA